MLSNLLPLHEQYDNINKPVVLHGISEICASAKQLRVVFAIKWV